MATRRAVEEKTEVNVADLPPRDPQHALEIFQKAKKQYLSQEVNVENLESVIQLFDSALSYDPANSEISAYLNYAKRDLSGFIKKKKGIINTSSPRGSRKSGGGGKDDILAAYETEDETKDDEDSEFSEDDDDDNVPSWDPIKANKTEEDTPAWEES